MPSITFISTIHKELGNCNAEELLKIIQKISPDVVFLEAIDDTYSDYEHHCFVTYGVSHGKLEVEAIQKYSAVRPFEYVPVCGPGLTDAFRCKNRIVCQSPAIQTLIDNYNSLAAEFGFTFLNSIESIKLQEELRELEREILNDESLDKIVRADIEAYEEPMLRNIYSYAKNNLCNTAIFMCGVAHRKAIIEKIEKYKTEHQNIAWTIFDV